MIVSYHLLLLYIFIDFVHPVYWPHRWSCSKFSNPSICISTDSCFVLCYFWILSDLQYCVFDWKTYSRWVRNYILNYWEIVVIHVNLLLNFYKKNQVAMEDNFNFGMRCDTSIFHLWSISVERLVGHQREKLLAPKHNQVVWLNSISSSKCCWVCLW